MLHRFFLAIMIAVNDVVELYAAGGELGRMQRDRNLAEWERTCELMTRWLPPAPADVADVGGGPGDQAAWLIENRYVVKHFDLTPLHVDFAIARGLDSVLADARELPLADESVQAAVILGPMYHVVDSVGRQQVLREAHRVLRPGGVLIAAALSRWARAFVRAANDQLGDPTWHDHTLRTMRDGHIDNGDAWDRSVYLYDVAELENDLAVAGFAHNEVVGIEGPIGAWARRDPSLNAQAIELARQSEKALAACSIHMLAKGIKPL